MVGECSLDVPVSLTADENRGRDRGWKVEDREDARPIALCIWIWVYVYVHVHVYVSVSFLSRFSSLGAIGRQKRHLF